MTASHAPQAEPPHPIGHHVPRDFPAPVRALAAVSRALAVLEGLGIGVSLVTLILLASYQVLSRNLRMHQQLWIPPAPEWTDSLLRHSVFILGFLGAAYATYTGRHIRVDAITRLVSWKPRMALRALTTLAAIAVCLVMASVAGAITLLRDLRHLPQPEMPDTFLAICRMESGEASQAGEVFTSERGALLIIAGFSLIAFHFLVQLVIDVVYLTTKRTPPTSWIMEAGHGEAPPTTNQEMMTPPVIDDTKDEVKKNDSNKNDSNKNDSNKNDSNKNSSNKDAGEKEPA